MKVLLILSLAIAVIATFPGSTATAKKRTESATVSQGETDLELSLSANKSVYRASDKIKLQVMLRNPRNTYIYTFGTLEWGYSASLLLHVRDATGKEVEPVASPDDRTHASPDDQSAFVKLPPHHFLGVSLVATLKFLNLARPGKYSILAEYRPPFSNTEVKLSPFWGKEKGAIKSNVIWIQVRP